MPDLLRVVSPVDGRIYAERPLADAKAIDAALDRARAAQPGWQQTPLAERAALISAAVDRFVAERAEIATEITWQMGRPIRFAPGEVGGFEERARHMIGLAEDCLGDLEVGAKPGFTRFIRRVPLGVVLVMAPWNYPYLTAVNSIVPALLAGNTVLLKHSAQTPLCAERLAACFAAAGLPEGVFQALHLAHADSARIIGSGRIDFVSFTGSVEGGHAVQAAAAGRFIGSGLELGGKDPAYVRADADLDHAIENLADGAFFNSGQSCCGIERIYVAAPLFDRFVEGVVAVARSYRLDDPTLPATTLGPMASAAGADAVRAQIAAAVAKGAKALVDPGAFGRGAPGSPYLAPQVLIGVDHGMAIMTEETFGPVVGIMPVESDEAAIRLMNDSRYGLTAAIWTADEAAAIRLGDQLETGTCFMNRCDYLDPALAWVGVKDSGRGCALSALGYDQLTRPKSFHLRTSTR